MTAQRERKTARQAKFFTGREKQDFGFRHLKIIISKAPERFDRNVRGSRKTENSEIEFEAPVARPPGSNWLKRAGWLALGAASSLTVAVGVASYSLSGLLVRPRLKRLPHLRRPHFRNLIKKIGIEFEEVDLHSADGLILQGWWMAASAPAATIIIVHGVKKNRTDVLRAAILLRQAGFNVLVYDGRGHGNSEGRYITYGYHERRDVDAVIEWLITEKQIDPTRIGLAGESMGAAISLQVAAHNERVKAVWADSPFASLRRVTEEYVSRITRLPESVVHPALWPAFRVANYRGKFDIDRVDPAALAAQIKCPVYLIHGTGDQLIPVEHSEHIHAALGGNKELWIVEGARHAKSIRHAKREYADKLIGFFSTYLLLKAEDLPDSGRKGR